MRYAAVAMVVGLGIGLVTGGSFTNLSEHRLPAWYLLPVGVAFQLASGAASGDAGRFLLLASYALLAAFALANVRAPGPVRAGMVLIAVGLGLNIATIALNGGMPVRASAIVDAGAARPDEVGRLRISGKHHLERPDDRLMPLSDVLPVRPLREVLSVGDVAMSAGIAWALAALLRRPARESSVR